MSLPSRIDFLKVIPPPQGAEIHIFAAGTTDLASLWLDAARTVPIDQPYIVGSALQWHFYFDELVVDIKVVHPAYPEGVLWMRNQQVVGPQGAKGDIGAEGPEGPTGPQGPQGIPGVQTHVTSGPPAAGLGVDDDLAIDELNHDYYRREAGSWVLKGNLRGADGTDGTDGAPGPQGPQGPPGVQTHVTSGPPAAGLGVDDDLAIDELNHDYYRREAGSWVLKGNLQGAPGARWLSSLGVPAGTLGVDGDWAIDLETDDYYERVAGAWVWRGQMGGSTGVSGLVQSAFVNIAQGAELLVTHPADPDGKRIVQAGRFIPGGLNLTNTSLDFDLADAGQFVQEDPAAGTEFVNGAVRLRSSAPTIDQVPSMTGYAAPAGEVIESGHFYSSTSGNHYYGWKAFDDAADDASSWTVLGAGGWLGYAFEAPTSVGAYSIVGTSVAAGRAPRDWVFEGSNDNGATWAPLDTRAGESGWAVGERRYFEISEPGAFGRYRIRVTANNGNAYTNIVDLELLPINDYPTDQPYYVHTLDAAQVPLEAVGKINSCVITAQQPVGTSILGVVSFDGRTTWRRWNGSVWEDAVAGELVTFDFVAGANTIAEIQAGLFGLTIAAETFLDFAFDLSTVDPLVSPLIDQITINYDEKGFYRVTAGDFEWDNVSSTQTRVRKLRTGTDNIKVNVLV